MTAPLSLDHIGLITPDLEASRASYARLGFRLTPRSSHRGRARPDGPLELWGSGNHCAMFRRGYLELLGITDPSRHHAHVTARLERYHGIQLIALGTPDVQALHASLAAGGADVRAPVELGREVPYQDGTKAGLFRLVYVNDAAFPEAELFFIEHATPEVLWQPPLLDQPNGVTGLNGVTICTADPTDTAERLAGLLGRPVVSEGSGRRVILDHGWIRMVDGATLAVLYRDARPPAVPSVAAATFEVSDVGTTRAFMAGQGRPMRSAGGGIWIDPVATGGGILEFVRS